MLQKIKWASDLLAAMRRRKRAGSSMKVPETKTVYSSRLKMDPSRPLKPIPKAEWERIKAGLTKGK